MINCYAQACPCVARNDNRHTPMLSDATIDATFQYTICDTDILMPEVTLDDLRGYDGGEYSPQEDRTAAYIENMKAEAA